MLGDRFTRRPIGLLKHARNPTILAITRRGLCRRTVSRLQNTGVDVDPFSLGIGPGKNTPGHFVSL